MTLGFSLNLTIAVAICPQRSFTVASPTFPDVPKADADGRWGKLMTPRFKGKLNFDQSVPCPSCGYKIQPRELVLVAAQTIKSSNCGAVFDAMAGKKPMSTS
jgi:hypothetical protein